VGKGKLISEIVLDNMNPRLLTPAKKRLGRRNVMEITDHPVFEGVDWISLPSRMSRFQSSLEGG